MASLVLAASLNPGGIIAWIVIGLLAGWLAGVIMPGPGFGLIGDLIVGLIGAFLGGLGNLDLSVLAAGLFVGGLVVLTMSKRMPARTAAGSAVLTQAQGFRRYLETAEADQIRFEPTLGHAPYVALAAAASRPPRPLRAP